MVDLEEQVAKGAVEGYVGEGGQGGDCPSM